MKSFSQSLVGVSVFASNILFWRTSGYFDSATELKPLIHTWSLSVEEQYYVLFPLFLFLAWKLGKRWVVGLLVTIAIASLALAQWSAYGNPSFAFYMLPTRAWELLIGAFVAFYYSEHNIKKHQYWVSELGGLFGLGLIGYATFTYSEQTPFPSFYALVPTIGAALIIIFATPKTLIGKLLSTKPFLWIGLISYSAYLWHQPLFAFARHRSFAEPSQEIFALFSFLSFFLAYMTWRFVERPFRNKLLISRETIFAMSFLCSTFFIVFGLFGNLKEGFNFRVSNSAKIAQEKGTSNYSLVANKDNYPAPSDSVVLGSKDNIVGVLIGDSHAQSFAYSLHKHLEKTGLGLINLTSSGCYPILDVYSNLSGPECVDFNRRNYGYILENNNLKNVVIIGRWTSTITGIPFDNQEGGVELFSAPLKLYIRKEDGSVKTVLFNQNKDLLISKIKIRFPAMLNRINLLPFFILYLRLVGMSSLC